MLPLAILFALVAGPALSQPITEAGVRAFVAEREAAWNAGDFARYFAGFTPDARFTDQAYVGDKPPVPYGTSTLAQARDQVRRSKSLSREAGQITRIDIAPSRASARVSLQVRSTLTNAGKTRTVCAARLQTLVAVRGRIRSSGQTDTYFKCRR